MQEQDEVRLISLHAHHVGKVVWSDKDTALAAHLVLG